jgi:hypothetical protein
MGVLRDVLVNKPLSSVYAGLPKNNSTFRINVMDIGSVYVYFNQTNRHWYLLSNQLGESLKQNKFVQGLYLARLFQGIEKDGNEFVALVTLSGNNYERFLSVMNDARRHWYVRKDVGDEIVFEKADADEIPEFRCVISELMRQAFVSRFIDSEHHPVIVNAIE